MLREIGVSGSRPLLLDALKASSGVAMLEQGIFYDHLLSDKLEGRSAQPWGTGNQ